jgi:LPS sulfotransferase NodH
MPASYIICTTPRSGSTLLCRLLASTGRAGNPDSFYHRDEFMREWAAEWGLPDADKTSRSDFDRAYLDAARRAGEAGTGIFGLRLQQEYMGLLSETLDRLYPGLPSDAHRLEQAFGTIVYIHLTRADKVAQAVSLVKAEQSGLWHRNADGTDYERLGLPREPAYDFKSIHREVAALEEAERAWIAWFDRHRIRPISLSYEALADHPAETVIEICRALRTDPPAEGTIKPPLAKLSDAVSLEWIGRYRADMHEADRGLEPRSS